MDVFRQRVGKGLEILAVSPSDCTNVAYQLVINKNNLRSLQFTLSHSLLNVLLVENVEVVDGKVTVCRDAVKGKCTRPNCKYYHSVVSPTAGASSSKTSR